jgi:hypothetical protein
MWIEYLVSSSRRAVLPLVVTETPIPHALGASSAYLNEFGVFPSHCGPGPPRAAMKKREC